MDWVTKTRLNTNIRLKKTNKIGLASFFHQKPTKLCLSIILHCLALELQKVAVVGGYLVQEDDSHTK